MPHRPGLPILLLIALTSGCADPIREVPTLNLTDILGGGTTEGYDQATQVRRFRFPDDHGPHPGFRNEWWYFTGNVETGKGRHFGYQVTFFRRALSAPGARDSGSRWAISDVWMAHVAVTDTEAQQHRSAQRFSRSGPGLAGVSIDPVDMWLDDWQVVGDGNGFPWRVTIDADEFSLQLSLTATKPLVLHGDRGLSRKSATVGNASYYYSYSRLATVGNIRIGEDDHTVTGNSWFDREWSTSSLDTGQTGWDWFSLQFDSGYDLMYYQLRDQRGYADGNSQGSWIDARGDRTPITASEVKLTVLKEWRNRHGQTYPIRWRMDYLERSWVIQATVTDQFMDLAIPYWEGAVQIHDPESMAPVGRGYLEMTRIDPAD